MGMVKSPSSKAAYCLARPEERQACEPEGPANGENAAGGFFQHSLLWTMTASRFIDGDQSRDSVRIGSVVLGKRTKN